MSYHWSKGTTVYTSSRFAQIFWWTIKNKRERSPEKEAAALNTGLSEGYATGSLKSVTVSYTDFQVEAGDTI